MNPHKIEIRKFLMEIKESGMIPERGYVLELGVGKNPEHFIIMHDRFHYTPTDWVIMDGVPRVQWLDAHDFSTSPLTQERKEWDAILALEVLEHCKYPGIVCREAFKHLKPDGLFVVTLPFWYRIHESSPESPDIIEEEMKDYWRITPSGLKLLFHSSGFREFYAAPVHRANDGKWNPSFVFGWARKIQSMSGESVEHKDWSCPLPDNWEEQQEKLEEEFERRYGDG